ncbi:PBSX family phage terminase large subunit, partial [Streptococcus agalactiae]|nr:PBSX family phage terminase large subunit [Streptococcus agalactiae]
DYLDRLDELHDWRNFNFTLDDNPALSEEYKESLKAEYTGLWYKRFILGQWVAAEGAVYDMWNPTEHVIPWENIPPIRQTLAVGMD